MPYDLDTLTKSAKERADYNFQLAQKHPIRKEQLRHYTQAAQMMVDIVKAQQLNDPSYLEYAKDW